jgi:hypothetical protein
LYRAYFVPKNVDPFGNSVLGSIPIIGTIGCLLTTQPGEGIGDFDDILTGGDVLSDEDCNQCPGDVDAAEESCGSAVEELANGYLGELAASYVLHFGGDIAVIITAGAVGGVPGIIIGGVGAADGVAMAACIANHAQNILDTAEQAKDYYCSCGG